MFARQLNLTVLLILTASLAQMTTILWVVLRLTHAIHWSWLWVLSPLWFTIVLNLFVVAFIFINYLASFFTSKGR